MSLLSVCFPAALVDDCLAYDRCVRTDGPIAQRLPVEPIDGTRVRMLGAPVLALLAGRPLSALVLLRSDGEAHPVPATSRLLMVPASRDVVNRLRVLRLTFMGFVLAELAAGVAFIVGWNAALAVGLLLPLALVLFRALWLRFTWVTVTVDRGLVTIRGVSPGFVAYVRSVVSQPTTGLNQFDGK